MNLPPTETDALIAALREELQQYGVLLRVLEAHHGTLARRRVEEVPALSAEIEQNLSVLMTLRERRRDEIESLTGLEANSLDQGDSIDVDGLLPYFPEMVAPMVQGLVEEVNRLVTRVSRFARQNHSLLSQAVEAMPGAFRTSRPDSLAKAYASLGSI